MGAINDEEREYTHSPQFQAGIMIREVELMRQGLTLEKIRNLIQPVPQTKTYPRLSPVAEGWVIEKLGIEAAQDFLNRETVESGAAEWMQPEFDKIGKLSNSTLGICRKCGNYKWGNLLCPTQGC